LLPGKARTYAPRAHPAIIKVPASRERLSVIAAMTTNGNLYRSIYYESIGGYRVALFLRHLVRNLSSRLLVIWDGSPIHRADPVANFLASKEGRHVWVERLPPYAPDLNPAEGIWSYLKTVELKNVSSLNLDILHEELVLAMARLRTKPKLIQSFFGQADLDISDLV
jgi:transposase